MTPYPYPGLRPFDQNEKDIFFGREEQTDELLSKLGHSRFLVILGPSGCGKSSLVRAGVIADLQTGFLPSAGSRWKIATFRPGNSPIRNLAKALCETGLFQYQIKEFSDHPVDYLRPMLLQGKAAGLLKIFANSPLPSRTNLLLVVDQFEEMFRYRDQIERVEADQFIEMLLYSTSQHDVPIHVILTMRSDFLGECAFFKGLPERINDTAYLIPRLTPSQCREAIVGPAQVFRAEVEDALVERLLKDMGEEPDQLPLMQHALMRMWNKNKPDRDTSSSPLPTNPTEDPGNKKKDKENSFRLTLQHYINVGGLQMALSNHAEEAYGELNKEEKPLAEILFRALGGRGSEHHDIRRPRILDEIRKVAGLPKKHLDKLKHVVDIFRNPKCSFLTPDTHQAPSLEPDTLIDISHESLLRQWGRLRKWLEKEFISERTYQRLVDRARLDVKGIPEPLSGHSLQTTLEWKNKENPSPVWARRYSKPQALPVWNLTLLFHGLQLDLKMG
jgi:energy-coupling factor transporter ATP-binding protein EcfA2